MKQAVTLSGRSRLDGIWKRYPVVLNRNGSIKANVVLIGDKEVAASEGNYILDWYENGKRMRKSVGKDAADAQVCQGTQGGGTGSGPHWTHRDERGLDEAFAEDRSC